VSKIQDIIAAAGGLAKFCRATGVPRRTAEDWKAEKRTPPPWVVALLENAQKKGRRYVV
jgi:DNA-binding transcriptional regulator YiaG